MFSFLLMELVWLLVVQMEKSTSEIHVPEN
jgi:hypothetical protein